MKRRLTQVKQENMVKSQMFFYTSEHIIFVLNFSSSFFQFYLFICFVRVCVCVLLCRGEYICVYY